MSGLSVGLPGLHAAARRRPMVGVAPRIPEPEQQHPVALVEDEYPTGATFGNHGPKPR